MLVAMTERSDHTRFTPEGWHTVTTRIVVQKVPQFVEFLKSVFGATGDYRPDLPTVMIIGDSMIMISEAGIRKPMPAFLYVYVADAYEIYRRAVEAGATSVEEPSVMPYGDRRGMLEDAWGNIWQIATYAPSKASEP
jgi:PhnB protein